MGIFGRIRAESLDMQREMIMIQFNVGKRRRLTGGDIGVEGA
jgi:hypothetical protein